MTRTNDIVCFSEQKNCYICLYFDNYEDKFHAHDFVCLVRCFTSQSTAMVMTGQSVHLTTFPGQA